MVGLVPSDSSATALISCNHGKSTFSYGNGRERRLPALNDDAYKDKQKGDTLKEAVSELMDRVNRGEFTSSYVYNNILKWCANERDLESVKRVHDLVKGSEMEQHPYVGTMFIECYIECGTMKAAEETLNKLLTKGTVIWNMMISGYVKHGQGDDAIKMYNQMRNEGGRANIATYLSVLKACASPTTLNWGEQIHAHIVRDGLQEDVRIGSSLVAMYAKCGSIEDARAVFGRMGRRDVVSWNVMIGALAEHGLGHEAFSLFLHMQREGFTPDAIIYLSILNPSSSAGALEWVGVVHALATRAGFDVDVRVQNSLIQMYAKSGSIEDARAVFGKMRNRDVVSFTMMIAGLAQHGHGREGIEVFERMKLEGLKPNNLAFVAVLSACSHAGLVEEGLMHFYSMRENYDIEPEMEHYTCVVDLLGRAGRLKEAEVFILNMPFKPDIVTWRTILGACRTHNNVQLAELAAEECLKLNPTEASTYVLLSNVYAAVGNRDQVARVRTVMKRRGVRKEPGRCWIEIDNKVHQFLVGDTKHPETREIYKMLSSLSKILKAEGYSSDTRLVLRDIAEEDKESALCSHSEKLAIAYGLIHVPPGKPIRVYKNLRICTDCHTASKLISRCTGREIVARDGNRFHHFKDGSCSCNDYW